MVLLQQATAYIFRKKTRNFILFLILFLILSCLYFCFSLMQVGGGMKAQIRKSSGASFALVSKERGSAFSWKEGEKISHLSDVMTTIPEYISPVRLIDKKVVLIMRLIKPWEPLLLRKQDKVLILGVVLFNSLRESTYLLKVKL